MAMSKVQLLGSVYDVSARGGVPGLQVEAWDTDRTSRGYSGKATTDESGAFVIEIECDDSGYDGPDLCFKVFCGIDLVLDTIGKVVWGGKDQQQVEIRVDMTGWRVPRKDCCDYQDVFLKIERIAAYSPAEPNRDAHGMYRRDCFRNSGHEDTVIPDAEVELRRLDALVYREYTDATFTAPVPDKLVEADVLEPPHYTRVPGAVIYTEPGKRLRICVLNCDTHAHSLHVHGLAYGVDSDGAYPFGVVAPDGRRSDEICPGETWLYEFEVRDDMVGCWPFHSHYRLTKKFTDQGLFGGIVVRDPDMPRPDHEVPFFMHRMVGERTAAAFDSGTITPGNTFTFTFSDPGTFDYYCRFHAMFGTVQVTATATDMNASVDILDSPGRYEDAVVQIQPGGTVTWRNDGALDHTVTEQGGGGALESFCINGRVFEGNTPRILAESGERVRWYVFNLDFGMDWHNFHTHSQRWKWGDEYVDTRSIGPAESFVVDTIVPDVILTPCTKPKKNEKRRKLTLCGDFPVHCHVEPHMMQGMTATLRAQQVVSLTKSQIDALGFGLPEECSMHGCPEVDLDRCKGAGQWEQLPDSEVFVVHAALLHTGKVLLFSGRAEQYHLPADYPLESRLFDPVANSQTTQVVGENLFCAGHTFLNDGRLLVAGGDRDTGTRIASTHVFDPGAESWTKLPNDMNYARWYPTVLTLDDGRAVAASGSGGPDTLEVFDPATETWTQILGANKNFNGLYPSLHLLPNHEIFWSRTSWNPQVGTTGSALQLTGAATGTWTDMAPMEFPDRQEGASVVMVDASVSPAATRIYVIGGGVAGTSNPQSMEMIDVTATAPAPTWVRMADMHYSRTNVNAVVLPTGRILVVGGQRGGKWAANPDPVYESETYDPGTDTWELGPAMNSPRQYHSVLVLLDDGRVLTAGGIDPTLGGTPQRDLRTMEMFSPAYMTAPSRPTIANVTDFAYGAIETIQTPDAVDIASVALIRPNSCTHHTDAGHRYIKLGIESVVGDILTVQAPADANVAPPGFYMLFIVNNQGVPSVASWLQVS